MVKDSTRFSQVLLDEESIDTNHMTIFMDASSLFAKAFAYKLTTEDLKSRYLFRWASVISVLMTVTKLRCTRLTPFYCKHVKTR